MAMPFRRGPRNGLQYSKGRQSFAFDRTFDWTTSQTDVFNYSARHVVEGTRQRHTRARLGERES